MSISSVEKTAKTLKSFLMLPRDRRRGAPEGCSKRAGVEICRTH
jgi:hypothetical protein